MKRSSLLKAGAKPRQRFSQQQLKLSFDVTPFEEVQTGTDLKHFLLTLIQTQNLNLKSFYKTDYLCPLAVLE